MQDTQDEQAAEEDESLFEQVWRDGIPLGERAIWALIDKDGRAVARARLRAMLSYEENGNWARRAEDASLSRPRFFSMLRAWRANRSLTALVPAALGRRGKGAGGSRQDLRIIVAEMLRDFPLMTKEQLTQRVIAKSEKAASATTVRHLVDEQRALATRAKLGGDDGFGRCVAIDSSPILLRRKNADGEMLGALVAMVIDQATSLVLSYAVDGPDKNLLRSAAENAGQWIKSKTTNISYIDATSASIQPTFEIVLRGDPVSILRCTECLVGLQDAIDVVTSRRSRPPGTKLLEAFGPTIGPLDVRPRAEIATEEVDGTREGMMAARHVVAELLKISIEKHNARILSRSVHSVVPVADLATALVRIANCM